jgi:hypothetical protein
MDIWLVVWNMFYFSIYWNNNPNWLSYFSEGFKPPTRYVRYWAVIHNIQINIISKNIIYVMMDMFIFWTYISISWLADLLKDYCISNGMFH